MATRRDEAVTIQTRIPSALASKLEAKAKADQRSVASYLRMLIADALESR